MACREPSITKGIHIVLDQTCVGGARISAFGADFSLNVRCARWQALGIVNPVKIQLLCTLTRSLLRPWFIVAEFA